MWKCSGSLAGLALAAGMASSVFAQSYQAIPLGSLGGSSGAAATCVNDNGEAVGLSDTDSGQVHAFYWSAGTMEDLGTLEGGTQSRALWINNSGQVVGGSFNSDGVERAVVWERNRQGQWTITDLGTLGGPSSFANKISNTGKIVGMSSRTSGGRHGFIISNGTMTDLGALHYPSTLGTSEAVGVNDAGQAVGYAYAPLWGPDHGWFYSGAGSPVDITPAGQFSFARGMAINTSGTAAGITILPGGSSTGFEAATWTQAGGWQEIGVLPGLSESEAYGINDAGQVVGRSFELSTQVFLAFVYRNGTMVDLNQWAPRGATFVEALAINNQNWIATNSDNGAIVEAFILRPVAQCYANCDGSTTAPILNVNDFICFQAKFAAGDSYANCDGSTTPPILNINDFICFQGQFASGCP